MFILNSQRRFRFENVTVFSGVDFRSSVNEIESFKKLWHKQIQKGKRPIQVAGPK